MNNRINDLNWKKYNLKKDLKFEIYHGKRMTKALRIDGNIPLLTAGKINQGIGSYVDNPLCKYEDAITIDMFGNSFYHQGICSGDDNIYFFVNEDISKYSKLFIVSVISKELGDTYSYINQFRQGDADGLSIHLPSTSNGTPDWNYMDKYIEKIYTKISKKIGQLNNMGSNDTKIDLNDWEPFHLYDLFYIDSGTKMDKIAMKYNNPTINFVGRSGINNGVTAVVDKVDDYEPFKAGNLTLALGGAYLGSCFVQKKDFYTSQNVVVLTPKVNMTFAAKQFICSVIFKEGNTNYKAFIDELNRHIKTDFSIKLPVDANGNPDYEFMDKYMNGLIENLKSKFKYFKNIQ